MNPPSAAFWGAFLKVKKKESLIIKKPQSPSKRTFIWLPVNKSHWIHEGRPMTHDVNTRNPFWHLQRAVTAGPTGVLAVIL